MNKKKKLIIGGALLASMVFAGYTFAEINPVTQMIEEFNAKKKQMESETDLAKQVALGNELKQKGIEIGKLQSPPPPTIEQRIGDIKVDLGMEEQYVRTYKGGQYKQAVEKFKPVHQMIEQIEANKEGKSVEERMKGIEQAYEMLIKTAREIHPPEPSSAPAP